MISARRDLRLRGGLSPFAAPPLPSPVASSLRPAFRMSSPCPIRHKRSCELGLSSVTGEGLDRLVVSPSGRSSFRGEGRVNRSPPSETKSTMRHGGCEPFLTAQRPTIKTPDMGEAGRLRFRTSPRNVGRACWVQSVSRKPFFLFPFFQNHSEFSEDRACAV